MSKALVPARPWNAGVVGESFVGPADAPGGAGKVRGNDPVEFTTDIIRQIAMDVGKQVVDHIEGVYSPMCDAVAWDSARVSIRNCTHNAIIEAVEAANKGEIEAMLVRHDLHRRTMRKLRKAAGKKY